MAEDRTVYKFEGDASGLIRALNKASKAIDTAQKEAKKLDDELEKVQTQAGKTAAGEVVLATASATAAGGMGALAAAASVAAVAVAAVAAVFAIVVVALAAVAAGFVAAAVGIHKMITAAGELYDELEPLYKLGALEPLPKEQIKAIKEYVKNWKALKVVFQDLLIAVAGNLATDLEALSFEILVVGIYLSDLVKSWLEGASLIKEAIVKIIISPVTSLALHLKGLLLFWFPIIKAAEALGIVSEGTFGTLNGLIDDTQKKVRKLAEEFVDNGTEYISDGLLEMMPNMDEARKKAEELKKALDAVGEKGAKDDEITFKSISPIIEDDEPENVVFKSLPVEVLTSFEKFQDLSGKISETLADITSRMTDLTDPTGQFRDIMGEVGFIFETLAETDFSSIGGALKGASSIAESLGNMIGGIIDKQIKGTDELTKKQKSNLKILFAIQKAAALSAIIINTAQAAIKAYALFGPPPSPVGIAAAATVAAIGAAQAGVVAAQKPPFHVGGVIPAAPGDQGVMINALPGESVLNREATAGLGAEGVAAINGGGRMAGGVTVEMVYKHKIFDSFVSDNISKGGPLRNAIKSGRRVGHRSRG